MIVNIFKVNWRGKINSVAERVVIIDLSDLTDLLEEPEVLMMILEKKKHRVMKKQTSSNQFLHVLHDTISILNTGEFLK